MTGNEYSYFLKALKWVAANKWKRQQGSLAIEANISSAFLSEIINGKKTAGFESQISIAKACGYQYDEFLSLGRKLLEKKETPDGSKKGSDTDLAKEAPKQEVKVGKKMDEEAKDLLRHYKEALTEISTELKNARQEVREIRQDNKEELSALRSEIDYLRKRNRELEAHRSQTQTSEPPPAAGGAEKKTA